MKKVLEERDAVAYWGTAPTGRREFSLLWRGEVGVEDGDSRQHGTGWTGRCSAVLL